MSSGDSIRPARSLEDLLAYARVMERRAAQRYKELADIMATHNNHEVSELFRRMSENEWLHVRSVDELSRELSVVDKAVLPGSGDRSLGSEVPQFADLHYLHSPHHAVKLAQQYERNAHEFYLQLAEAAGDAQLRSAALRLAAEEETHLRELDRWLLRYPDPDPDWDRDFDPPESLD